MGDPGIVFDGVWKKFKRGERHDSLRDLIPAAGRRLLGRSSSKAASDLESNDFWAVRDVSFEVKPGEALGIIGPNGAGKSTTLKLLTRILKPTRGSCQVRGRVGALIEVAAGFHPDLTGRENVFLQGAIMGMKRAEILTRFDEIVEFAGVGDFIDTQVKRYSSGMNARLGFAIAAHLDPDVMIIDEVLSVGDAGFQDKCVRHMRGMIKRGVPVVFVSHNLPAIIDLCTRCVVINRGTVVFSGATPDAVQEYRTSTAAVVSDDGEYRPISIAGVQLLDHGEPSSGVIETHGDLTVRIRYKVNEPVKNPHFAVDIHRGDGVYCFGAGTFQTMNLGELIVDGTIDMKLPRLSLLPGCYTLSVGIHRGDGQGTHDLHLNAYPFSVSSETRDFGIVALDPVWEHRNGPPGA